MCVSGGAESRTIPVLRPWPRCCSSHVRSGPWLESISSAGMTCFEAGWPLVRDAWRACPGLENTLLLAQSCRGPGVPVQDFLVSGLIPMLASVLEAGKPQAWEHIRRAWKEEMGVCQEELEAALQGFALTSEESSSIRAAVEAAGRKAVEDKTRELAKRALPLMKERSGWSTI